MKTLSLKKISVLAALSLVLLLASAVQISGVQSARAASDTYTLLEPLPCVPGNGVACTAGQLKTEVNFRDYVQYMFNLLIAIAAVAAVFMIVWGGLQYMTQDSYTGKSAGLEKFRNAVLGLILVLCAYLILRTIDPRLVEIPASFVPQLELKGLTYSSK